MIRPGKGGYSVTACDVCGQFATPPRRPWMRVRHDFCRRDLCGDCEPAVVRRAEDRGKTPADWSRIIEVGRALGGEVWRVGDVLYWFRDAVAFPAHVANTSLLVADPPPAPRRHARSRRIGWLRFLRRAHRSPRG